MYHSAQSRWFITSVFVVSSASVGKCLYVGGFGNIFLYLLAWRSSVFLSHACMFDVTHDFLVRGRMYCGTYSAIALAVLWNSLFNFMFLFSFSMLGCAAGHMRSHEQNRLALYHSEKQAHFEGHCLAPFCDRLVERDGSHRAVRDACLLPKLRSGAGPLFGASL